MNAALFLDRTYYQHVEHGGREVSYMMGDL